jgi:hypothetical protein
MDRRILQGIKHHQNSHMYPYVIIFPYFVIDQQPAGHCDTFWIIVCKPKTVPPFVNLFSNLFVRILK